MANYNWNKFVLYIKRAELNQDEDYIKRALEPYGVVSSINFILKTNEKGHKYNGVIVSFSNMKLEEALYQLIEQFETNDTKMGKIYHNDYRYWIVHEYIQQNEELQVVTQAQETYISHCDTNEQLVFEYNILQRRCEMQEQKMMTYEEEISRKWFENVDLQIQVERKDCFLEWKKEELEKQKKEYEDKLNEKNYSIYHFKRVVEEQEKQLTNKNRQIESLTQELDIVSNMLSYYEQKYGSYISDCV
jgi:predicted RNase H-like nuclease (RuvC/YqgF family)